MYLFSPLLFAEIELDAGDYVRGAPVGFRHITLQRKELDEGVAERCWIFSGPILL